mmetsp:Transcript_77641/g.203856  ORF Transcript_77641/g.203856 Transcript_77641/m.203856 type:complete len:127 (+) Transcript_77641:479-859(+)
MPAACGAACHWKLAPPIEGLICMFGTDRLVHDLGEAKDAMLMGPVGTVPAGSPKGDMCRILETCSGGTICMDFCRSGWPRGALTVGPPVPTGMVSEVPEWASPDIILGVWPTSLVDDKAAEALCPR